MITAQECMKVYTEADNAYKEIKKDEAKEIAKHITEEVYDRAKMRKTEVSISLVPKEKELRNYWEPILIELGYKVKWMDCSVIVVSYQ